MTGLVISGEGRAKAADAVMAAKRNALIECMIEILLSCNVLRQVCMILLRYSAVLRWTTYVVSYGLMKSLYRAEAFYIFPLSCKHPAAQSWQIETQNSTITQTQMYWSRFDAILLGLESYS